MIYSVKHIHWLTIAWRVPAFIDGAALTSPTWPNRYSRFLWFWHLFQTKTWSLTIKKFDYKEKSSHPQEPWGDGNASGPVSLTFWTFWPHGRGRNCQLSKWCLADPTQLPPASCMVANSGPPLQLLVPLTPSLVFRLELLLSYLLRRGWNTSITIVIFV